MADLVAGADDDLRARWDGLRLGYTESQGLPELRAEIATLYERVDAEQVLVAAPEEAIFLTMHALLAPGDHVICTFPGYQSLYELARSIGCEVDLWEPEESSGMALRPGRAGGLATPRHQACGLELPPQPDRRAALGRRLLPHGGRGRPGRRLALLRRDVPAAGACARAAPAAGGRPLRASRLAGRHVQGFRAGGAAHRLGGGP